MLVDDTVTFIAVAAAQDGSVVPVTLTAEVDDPVLASVEENEPGNWTVTGDRRGDTSFIVKAADRGIKISIPLSVHNEIKGIVITPAIVETVEKGTPVDLMATAYDKKSGDDKTTNDGNEVPGVSFSWSSSNTAVATVDTENSNSMPTIKTHAAGETKIQARIGDVKSNEVEIKVYAVDTPSRRIVVDTANQPYNVAATVDTSETDVAARTVTFVSGPTAPGISVRVQQLGVKEDGSIGYINVADGTKVTFISFDKAILNLAGDNASNTATTTDGVASYAIVSDDLGTGNGIKAVGDKSVTVRIRSPFAADRFVTVTVKTTPS